MLDNGMNVIGVDQYFQQAIYGAMIILGVAVTFDRRKTPVIKEAIAIVSRRRLNLERRLGAKPGRRLASTPARRRNRQVHLSFAANRCTVSMLAGRLVPTNK